MDGWRRAGRWPTPTGVHREAGIEERLWASPPEATSGCPCGNGCCHETTRVASPVTSKEVGCGRTELHHLNVHVDAVPIDVTQKAPVPVDLIECRVGFQEHYAPDGRQT